MEYDIVVAGVKDSKVFLDAANAVASHEKTEMFKYNRKRVSMKSTCRRASTNSST